MTLQPSPPLPTTTITTKHITISTITTQSLLSPSPSPILTYITPPARLIILLQVLCRQVHVQSRLPAPTWLDRVGLLTVHRVGGQYAYLAILRVKRGRCSAIITVVITWVTLLMTYTMGILSHRREWVETIVVSLMTWLHSPSTSWHTSLRMRMEKKKKDEEGNETKVKENRGRKKTENNQWEEDE